MSLDEALFLHLHRLLADQAAKVVHASSHRLRFLFDFDLGDIWAVDREYLLDAFAIRNAANRERLLNTGALASDHDTGKHLDTTFFAFSYQGVYLDTVAYLERRDFGLELFFRKFVYDLVHYINPLVNLVFAFAFVPLVLAASISRFPRDFRIKEPRESASLETRKDA